jgi:hypothetical protein
VLPSRPWINTVLGLSSDECGPSAIWLAPVIAAGLPPLESDCFGAISLTVISFGLYATTTVADTTAAHQLRATGADIDLTRFFILSVGDSHPSVCSVPRFCFCFCFLSFFLHSSKPPLTHNLLPSRRRKTTPAHQLASNVRRQVRVPGGRRESRRVPITCRAPDSFCVGSPDTTVTVYGSRWLFEDE